MAGFTFPTTPAGLVLEVVIGVDGQSTVDLQTKGLPVPRPVAVPALIDTGSDVTVISPQVVAHLGLAIHSTRSAQSTLGSAAVRLFQVSMSIYGPSGVVGPALVVPYLLVMEFPAPLPGVEALVGRDVLAECLLLVDGPRRQFTLAF